MSEETAISTQLAPQETTRKSTEYPSSIKTIIEVVRAIDFPRSLEETTLFLNNVAAFIPHYPDLQVLLGAFATTEDRLKTELSLLTEQIATARQQHPSDGIVLTEVLDTNTLFKDSLTISPLLKLICRSWLEKTTAYEAVFEKKYEVMRVDAWRKQVAMLLQNGMTGTVLQVDLAGLNAFNKIGVEIGDKAIMRVSQFCKMLATKFPNLPHTALIGRKGDEFYLFLPKATGSTSVTTLQATYAAWSDEERTIHTTQGVSKKIILYLRAMELSNLGSLNQGLELLENSIEAAKSKLMQAYVEELRILLSPNLPDEVLVANFQHLAPDLVTEQSTLATQAKSIRQQELPLRATVLFLLQKRVPEDLIIELISAATEKFQNTLFAQAIQKLHILQRHLFLGNKPTKQSLLESKIRKILKELDDPRAAALPRQVLDYALDRASQNETMSQMLIPEPQNIPA